MATWGVMLFDQSLSVDVTVQGGEPSAGRVGAKATYRDQAGYAYSPARLISIRLRLLNRRSLTC